MDAPISRLMRVAILGGTFDPIHIGHLIIAQEVKEKFKLDKVFFIPVGNPPHKDLKYVTPSHIRLDMVNRAILDNDNFEVLDYEVKRQGYTYAVDTLNELVNKYEKTKFYYIIGADVVFDILTWRDYETVFKLCEFIAVLRPQFDINKYNQRITDLKDTYGATIHTFKGPLIEASSTDIRRRIKEGASMKYFITQSVENYILEKGLYR